MTTNPLQQQQQWQICSSRTIYRGHKMGNEALVIRMTIQRPVQGEQKTGSGIVYLLPWQQKTPYAPRQDSLHPRQNARLKGLHLVRKHDHSSKTQKGFLSIFFFFSFKNIFITWRNLKEESRSFGWFQTPDPAELPLWCIWMTFKTKKMS